MDAFNVAEAKAKFSELIDRVEAGESIDVMRRGRLIARVSPATPSKQAVNPNLLAAARAGAPRQPVSAGEFVRTMRDADRY